MSSNIYNDAIYQGFLESLQDCSRPDKKKVSTICWHHLRTHLSCMSTVLSKHVTPSDCSLSDHSFCG